MTPEEKQSGIPCVLIGTDGNVLATERFQQNATQYYLYNKDIQESTSSLVKEDGSADATYRYTDFGETTINGDNNDYGNGKDRRGVAAAEH